MPCPYTLHHHTVRARHALPLHHPTPSHRTGTACRAPYTRLPQSVPHHTVRARHAVPPTRACPNPCPITPYGHGMPCPYTLHQHVHQRTVRARHAVPLHHPTPTRAPTHRTGTACRAPYITLHQSVPHHTVLFFQRFRDQIARISGREKGLGRTTRKP